MPVAEDTSSISEVISQLHDYAPTVRKHDKQLNRNFSTIVLTVNLIIFYRFQIPLLLLYVQKLDLKPMIQECKLILTK